MFIVHEIDTEIDEIPCMVYALMWKVSQIGDFFENLAARKAYKD